MMILPDLQIRQNYESEPIQSLDIQGFWMFQLYWLQVLLPYVFSLHWLEVFFRRNAEIFCVSKPTYTNGNTMIEVYFASTDVYKQSDD